MLPYWTPERLSALPMPEPSKAFSVAEKALPGGWASKVDVEWRTLTGHVIGRGHFYKRASA